MASELRVNTLKDAAGNNSVGMSYVANGSAKALLWYNGSGNSIDTSFNISSVTDNSTGTFFPNLTNALASSKEITSGETARNGIPNLSGTNGTTQNSPSQIRCLTTNTSGSETDAEFCMATHGDLA